MGRTSRSQQKRQAIGCGPSIAAAYGVLFVSPDHRYAKPEIIDNIESPGSGSGQPDRVFPYSPFVYFFMDSEYDKQYRAEDRFQQVFGALTGFAILISCLGLFGLATFTVSKRTKEIGIRKVVGASTANLMILLSKDFLRTCLLSLLIGLPLTYFIVKNWLSNYASRIELNWWLFAAPALLVFFLVLISIGSKTIATALMNPVKSLRSE